VNLLFFSAEACFLVLLCSVFLRLEVEGEVVH
jgi:hypothetical protein